MSSYIKASQTVADTPARTKFKIDNGDETRLPAVKKIDVGSLEIDDSYELDCDPYNSTGQHLVDAVKEKLEE